MITKKLFKTINELQEVQRLATHCPDDVAFHSLDSQIIIDAKSYIGMYALDFSQPVLVVSENENFHKQIDGIGENVAE
ncbi:hypothetical protein [Anaerolentibacter hominis]|uniref:hypothetical protein n=1 Tax=Anaerolentibacter hominis TaxID=3079009 RepID=UPI0031B85982